MEKEYPKTTRPTDESEPERKVDSEPEPKVDSEAEPKLDSEPETTTKPTGDSESKSDLVGSAKIISEAAQAMANKQTDKIDKAKVAGAADELLEAAQTYGKLDDKGVGQYIDKAQGYLHQMSTGASGGGNTDAAEPKKKEETSDGGSGGGLMKMAQGFFK